MSKRRIDRREAFRVIALGAGAAGLLPQPALGSSRASGRRTRGPVPKLDLEDPRERARIRASVAGSTAEETVYTFCRLHLYLWLNDGNLQPMLTMANLNAATWKPLPDGRYAGRVHEVGVYTRFDTDELVDSWTNPVTGETREVWQFLGGPLEVVIGPDGTETGAGATLKPKPMRMEVLGDQLLVPNQSAFSFPNPFKPDKWPKEAGEPTYYWDSHYLFVARLADVADRRISSAPALVQFQNLVSFHPWLGMGQRGGRTYGKAFGAKLHIDQLPPAVRRNLEAKTPQIFDLANWPKKYNDFADYMRERNPT